MAIDILYGAIAAFGGLLIAYANYSISKRFIKDDKKNTAYISIIVRQVINIVYLVAVWLLATPLAVSQTALLIGAALGITLPSGYFTRKLLHDTDGEDKPSGKDNPDDTQERS